MYIVDFGPSAVRVLRRGPRGSRGGTRLERAFVGMDHAADECSLCEIPTGLKMDLSVETAADITTLLRRVQVIHPALCACRRVFTLCCLVGCLP